MFAIRGWHSCALVFVAAASACGGARITPSSTIDATCVVDLTYTYDDTTICWPTAPHSFEKETLSYGRTHGGYFYSSFAIATPEHCGTHLDAPIHFAEGKATTEAVPLERLIAPAVVIDMSDAASNDRDALLTVKHIEAFESEHGAIEPGTIVLVRTGWAKYWPDRKRYLGDDTPGNVSNLHFPGVSKEAAGALVAREVAAVGIDTASIDHGPSKDFISHRVLLEASIPAFENVRSLRDLPPRGAHIIALPMKTGGGSGGPLRIVAAVPYDGRLDCAERRALDSPD